MPCFLIPFCFAMFGNCCCQDKQDGDMHEDISVSCREVSACPGGLLHGTVHAAPYPGYVHGNHPAICPHGCTPSVEVGAGESWKDKLLREAIEFQELYHGELGHDPGVREARVAAVSAQIDADGTYTHTFEELEYGAQVAWRNAPKCSNRKFWDELHVVDRRDARTNQDMFEACLAHLATAIEGGVTAAYMTVFPPSRPESPRNGPRVWNSQLLRFASYKSNDGTVVGDPANLSFTEMLQRRFRFTPEEGERFGVLPLVVQALNCEPECFPIPRTFHDLVSISHPDYPQLSQLGMKWYSVPVICAMDLEIGGITYTGLPFNGWYADTEVVRDLADEGRYDMLPKIAGILGLNPCRNPLWRDEALTVLNKAVLHSFHQSQRGMVDHHALIRGFVKWYHKEKQTRGYCPGNWKWIIPPLAASQSPAYLQLNKMTEYTLKPVFLYAPGWASYEKVAFGNNPVAENKPSKTMATFNKKFAAKAVVVYTTISGTTRYYAENLVDYLRDSDVAVICKDAEDLDRHDVEKFGHMLEDADVLVLLTPTYGGGDLPHKWTVFQSYFQSKEILDVMKDKPFVVLGFGSHDFPRFCGAADKMEDLLAKRGCRQVIKAGKFDASGESCMAEYRQWRDEMMCSLCSKFPLWVNKGAAALSAPISGSGIEEKALPQVFIKMLSHDEVGKLAMTEIHGHAGAIKVDVLGKRYNLCTVTAAEKVLVSKTKDRETTLLSFDMSPTGASYAPGDYVSILPTESSSKGASAAALCEGLHMGMDQVFIVSQAVEEGQPGYVHKEQHPLLFQIMDTHITLGKVLETESGHAAVISRQGCLALSQIAAGKDASTLEECAHNEEVYYQLVKGVGMRWNEIFQRFPSLKGRLQLPVLLALLPLNHLRLYSAASSPRENPNECSVLVRRLAYKATDGTLRYGRCSNYVNDLKVGSKIAVKIITNTSFRMPVRNTAPIIMISAGTGLAPFRGFWRERMKLKGAGTQLGKALLFHGSRCKAESMFTQELEVAKSQNVLTDVFLCYSREASSPKIHVQDLLEASSGAVRPLLEDPTCCVYVCGDAQMEDSVTVVLEKMNPECFAKMTEQRRYRTDTFGQVNREH